MKYLGNYALALIQALLLGLCSVFGGVPLVGQHQWPLWFNSQVPDSGVPQLVELGPHVAASTGDTIHVLFPTNDPTRFLAWSRSEDAGRTWTPLAPVPIPVNSSFSGPQMVADGDDVFIITNQLGLPPFGTGVAVSADRGASWSLRRAPLQAGYHRVLKSQGAIILDYDGLLFVTTDLAASWMGPFPVGGWGQVPFGGLLQLVERAGVLHAVWSAGPFGSSLLYYASSSDLGQTWTPASLVGGPAGSGSHTAIKLAVGDGWIAVVAADDQNHWCRHSLDGGNSWATTMTAPKSANTMYDAVADGRSIAMVWTERGFAGRVNFWCLHSVDGGQTWSSAPQLIGPSGAGVLRYWRAYANLGAFTILSASEDCFQLPCTRRSTLYASNDGGQSWSQVALRPSLRGIAAPVLVASQSALFAIWQFSWWYPFTTANPQVEFLAGGRTLGGGAAGTAGLVPTLDVDRLPIYGKPVELQLRQGLPGALALLAVGLLRPPVPLFAGLLTIDPVAQVLLSLRPASAPEPGSADFAWTVNAAMLQFDLGYQAFVLDQGAVGGVAASNGMELRVY